MMRMSTRLKPIYCLLLICSLAAVAAAADADADPDPPGAKPDSSSSQSAQPAAPPAPLTFHIGTASITPVGFMDFTAVFRDKTGGSGIGTNFGAIPFNNTVAGKLSEFRFSAQNSRIGFRVDANVGGANVIGYLESDFLGFSPGNAAVSSNSNSLRLRLYWVDLKKNRWELLAGQSWSLLTPGRKGISPLPGDLFYTQAVDVNYQVGLTWGRGPQIRVVYRPSSAVTVGLSLEGAEQYGGGSAGAGVITIPSGLASAYASQVNTGGTTFSVPTLHPDVIGKIAFDPKTKRAVHFEVAGLLSDFKFYNPQTARTYVATGGGVSANFNVEAAHNLRLIANTFYSDGGGRWIFGQGPDLIVRGDGSPSLVHALSTVSGFEYQAGANNLLYGYYGGAYFGRNVAIDPANRNPVGYGYAGSPNSHNRAIQEGTFGLTHTVWKNSSYGAFQVMAQYSYVTRSPWYVAPGQPHSAHANMVFLNLRYALPGAPPR
jgi:hypothetical protein